MNSTALMVVLSLLALFGAPVAASVAMGWPTNSLAALGCGVAAFVVVVLMFHGYNAIIKQRHSPR